MLLESQAGAASGRFAASGRCAASGRLNEFQRTMLQWSGLHPYNAVHVARLEGALDPGRLEAAARHVLTLTGLSGYSLEARSGRYRYEGGPSAITLARIDGGTEPESVLWREMERQLNEAFPASGPFDPFRLFWVDGGDHGFFGIAYYHVVADAESVGRLLGEILAAAQDEQPLPLRDARLAERSHSRGPRTNPFAFFRRVRGAYRKMQAMRRSFRSPDCPVNRFDNAWFGRSLDAEATRQVLARAKAAGATVNDLCLAALLKAVIPAASGRFEKSRRHLSAGCVVNLRRDLPEERRGDFGLFLGSFSVTHAAPPEITLADLIREVATQTAQVKRERLYLASTLEFRINRFLFARKPIEKQRNFYRKAYPVWGSITNYRMEQGIAGANGRVSDYYRAVSAGPALPFVVGVTGYEGRLNFGFTYRPDVIRGEVVTDIADRFLKLITEGEA